MSYKTLLADEKDYDWKEEQELLIKKWADKAICFKLMHDYTSKSFWWLNNILHIPIITI